jgi:hypothetical protein
MKTATDDDQMTATVHGVGIHAVLRQVASAAAITWGLRMALNQATDAQDQVSEAQRRLAKIYKDIEQGEARLAWISSRIDVVGMANTTQITEMITKAIQSGDFDESVLARHAEIVLTENQPEHD